MISSYAGSSRAPRPQAQQRMPSRAQAQPGVNAIRYHTLDDVEDYVTRANIERIQEVLGEESVQRCYDALVKTKNNVEQAKTWLVDTYDRPDEDRDELGSQPSRPAAKQEIKAPTQSIAQRYAGSTQAAVKTSKLGPQPEVSQAADEAEDEDQVKPRRRLLQGRKPRLQSPPSSPSTLPQKLPQPRRREEAKRQTVVISDDDDDAAYTAVRRNRSEDVEKPSEREELAFEKRLLEFFNTCTPRDLAELSAQPESTAEIVLAKRPFRSIAQVEAVSSVPAETKTGRKSKARPVGEKLVEVCRQMLAGYEAVDELVNDCEQIARPIQEALQSWTGKKARATAGELELMNLDDAHDSGIGTPLTSDGSDDAQGSANRSKSKQNQSVFLKQPANMSIDLQLKDYQVVGLNWLNLLWQKRISCILADDMGLGKTCQVIAFLAHLQQQAVDGVHLVIVPGSTLENWLREFARFAPSLNVFPYYGSDKERPDLRDQIEDQFDTLDVIVTTYEVARSMDDNRFLRKSVQPAVCVFDEAHQLRNPFSQRYEQLAKIPADFRLLLTGTPLQNNLQELVAILAFIMPELFQEKREKLDFIFKAKASTKDADHAALLSAERISRARTMMTPFILRRKKAQVLDLPAKHSRVEWCDMTPAQAAYYHEVVSEAQEVLSAGGVKAAKARASSNIIMALRQAAIHPLLRRRLYTDKKIEKIVAELRKHDEFRENPADKIRAYLTSEANTGQNLKGGDFAIHRFCEARPYLHRFALKKTEWMDSGKVRKFKELMEAYMGNGDRVLVFSQFTTVMDILEAVLSTLDINFMRLDGSTKMDVRQSMIDQFTNTDIPVFMLSTKAGGAGINLAAANKVIIFDSGFNPQDDIQAENRAHRVGQTRDVEVVRLVTRGTIEEQIHALGESKLALDERVAGEGAEEGKQAEKQGEQMVREMFLDSLNQDKEHTKLEASGNAGADLKEMFKAGMEGAGQRIVSKQAQF
ncbi:hypothetical protein BAUCODRAFT_72498 [Baudoinia panamericana UAMH 10762]|uniref:DNA helicase n=1 Tax=Baudoinia panamericana (strain UAMH 10762) TaxID=717646 RepID=M2MTS5_BAUPA|nr:uncharacterized protein BAUCODRAFT_72498 [Baudoinia panamericana UAMH 10762]EMC94938.1 hypothetical protein BAUCODRAFT_72498 [Baudoinia panamericana UAMH 10762]